MAAYATRRDVYRYGLPRGTLGADARPVASVATDTDVIELADHGFETDDAVVVRAFEGGSLPEPLQAGTVYYAIRVSDSHLKLAAAPGGSAIDIWSQGEGVAIAAELPFDEVLEVYSRWVDGVLPHRVPLEEPYPTVVVATVAELAAKKLLHLSGQRSESVDAAELAAKAQLERWARGEGIRDERATASTNIAARSSLSTSGSSDPRGWGSGRIP